MASYAAFLRAINVGGRRITGEELCVPFSDGLGFSDVSSFRASGNVVFTAPEQPPEGRIEFGLEKALGYDVEVFVRTRAEVLALAAAEPFEPGAKFHVMFLKRLPPAEAQERALALGTDDDRLAFGERELFWRPRGRMTDSELDLKAIGKLIGSNTMRTSGTVEQIAAKYFGG
ncbi:MAG: hypothetical protein QOJ57_905 [Thermoleophilaceae bacterium]|nr:hypothetical protein [Thermoleophilaceae bacterium]